MVGTARFAPVPRVNQRTILLRSEVAGKKCLPIGRVELLQIADI